MSFLECQWNLGFIGVFSYYDWKVYSVDNGLLSFFLTTYFSSTYLLNWSALAYMKSIVSKFKHIEALKGAS